jgi:hypothetical protein
MERNSTYEELVGGARTRLRATLKELQSFNKQHSITVLPLYLLLRSMNMANEQLKQLKQLKSYTIVSFSQVVNRTALYNNAKRLMEDTHHALSIAAITIRHHYMPRIMCSFCGLETNRTTECHARHPDTKGSLPKINRIYQKYNGPRTLFGKWPTKAIEQRLPARHSIVGGFHTGREMQHEALIRDAKGESLDTYLQYSTMPMSERHKFINAMNDAAAASQ